MNHDRTIYPHPHMPGVWLDAEGRTYVDAQAAEVERLRAEVEALRTGVPLTAENAPRASLVGYKGMILEQHEFLPGKFGWALQVGFRPGVDPYAPAEFLVARGATVLAWRRP